MANIPRLWAFVHVGVVALAAGFLAWYIGELTLGYYKIPASAQSRGDFRALNRENLIVVQKNTAIAYGAFARYLGCCVERQVVHSVYQSQTV